MTGFVLALGVAACDEPAAGALDSGPDERGDGSVGAGRDAGGGVGGSGGVGGPGGAGGLGGAGGAGGAGDLDAGVHFADAATDGGADPADATTPDAIVADATPVDGSPVDAGMEWGACNVGEIAGDCLDVADCDGDRHPVPGHCPGPAAIQCCVAGARDFACDPDDHPRPNEGLAEPPGEGGCPAGMVPVADFCMHRFEAALVEVTADGDRSWSPYHSPGARRVRAVSISGAVPQGYINGAQAAGACAEAGARLCNEAEWRRACRGVADRLYPYGDDRDEAACNGTRDRHPAVELFPDDPTPFDRIQDACINQLPEGLARTGAYERCVSPEGVFDLVGNLHEWIDDPAGTFRGGFYVDTLRNGAGCLYRTTAHDTGHWDYSTGFRCCADRRAR